jgi:hypothetical protein
MFDQNIGNEIRVGAPPPDFLLPQIGKDLVLGPSDLVGHPTIIFMWASW